MFLRISAALALVAAANALDGSVVAAIAPAASSCLPSQADCRTATQAAPFVAKGFCRQGIASPAVQAAAISLMAFESGDFKYKHNISPGRPGQGTANMQMWNYNLEYAKSIPELKDKAAGGSMDVVMPLVTADEYNFGSAAWFLKAHCSDAMAALEKGGDLDGGFAKYMACVGVQVTPERTAYWTRAKKAFNL